MNEVIFSGVGFDESLRDVFAKIVGFIEKECNAKIYKPLNMKQVRAAYVAPAEGGKKKAEQVFVMIEPRKKSMVLLRRRKYREGKPMSQWRRQIDSTFSDWKDLEAALREWSLDPKHPKKPKTEYEFGDGVALPGGLPETDHSKF